MEYWFVMGVDPHQAKFYNDEEEKDMCVVLLFFLLIISSVEAMSFPWCVDWGKMGLDYHYDTSPRDVQRVVVRQLRQACG